MAADGAEADGAYTHVCMFACMHACTHYARAFVRSGQWWPHPYVCARAQGHAHSCARPDATQAVCPGTLGMHARAAAARLRAAAAEENRKAAPKVRLMEWQVRGRQRDMWLNVSRRGRVVGDRSSRFESMRAACLRAHACARVPATRACTQKSDIEVDLEGDMKNHYTRDVRPSVFVPLCQLRRCRVSHTRSPHCVSCVPRCATLVRAVS